MNLPALYKLFPGLGALLQYRREDLPFDLRAGLTVAAVALPISFANAQIAGFSPVVGLYSFLLPMTIYVWIGSSRHLVIGPDAATAAVVASAIAPLANGDATLYATYSMVLALMVGVICIAGSIMRLGAIADFLSRPILMGFLHGVAIQIVVDQAPALFGFKVDADDVVPAIREIVQNIPHAHPWTVAISIVSAAVLLGIGYWAPRIPAALAAMAVAALAVYLCNLQDHGVATIGKMAAGLPHLRFDLFRPEMIRRLLGVAGGVAAVSYAGVILDARVFASKNGYTIDADREFAALGICQIASGASQGFCAGSLDSGAALMDATKGRTQLAGLISVAAIVVVISFLMPLLAYVPQAALAVIVLSAAWAMTDLPYLRDLFKLSKSEFAVAMVALVGVIALGAIDGIVVAVVLALLRFVRLVSRPEVEVLGEIPGTRGYHAVKRNPDAKTVPGLLIYRFSAPIVFFNAPYFRKALIDACNASRETLHWVIVDAIPVSQIDVTGWEMLTELMDELDEKGIRLVVAGRRTQFREYAERLNTTQDKLADRLFPTVGTAVRQYVQERAG